MMYRSRFTAAGLGGRFVAMPTVASCYALFRCRDTHEAGRVRSSLTRHRVEYRLWYGGGVHGQPYFADVSRDSLVVTDEIAPVVVGLPMAPDLPSRAIARVVAATEAGIGPDA